jgi:hypothetical protein
MRIVDVLVASALLGVALGILVSGEPSAARAGATIGAASPANTCERLVCESMTWLRTPVMRRAATR